MSNVFETPKPGRASKANVFSASFRYSERSNALHHPHDEFLVAPILVVNTELGYEIFIPVVGSIRKRMGDFMDRLTDASEAGRPVRPSKKIIAAGLLASAGLYEGQTGEQTPVGTVSVGFHRYEDRGEAFCRGSMIILEKPPENCFAKVEFLLILCDVLILVNIGGTGCRRCYAQDTCCDYQT